VSKGYKPAPIDPRYPHTLGGATGAAAGAAAGREGTHDGDSSGRSGGRSMMDRITGRHPESDNRNDHGHEPLETQRMSTPADGRADDRVIDDRTGRTDVGAPGDQHGSGRHRDSP